MRFTFVCAVYSWELLLEFFSFIYPVFFLFPPAGIVAIDVVCLTRPVAEVVEDDLAAIRTATSTEKVTKMITIIHSIKHERVVMLAVAVLV